MYFLGLQKDLSKFLFDIQSLHWSTEHKWINGLGPHGVSLCDPLLCMSAKVLLLSVILLWYFQDFKIYQYLFTVEFFTQCFKYYEFFVDFTFWMMFSKRAQRPRIDCGWEDTWCSRKKNLNLLHISEIYLFCISTH